jgi:predicted Fe-Mo cluster-binding NifX family protein
VNTLKIAITSEGPALTDRVDPRFGRAGGFLVVELDTMATSYVDNGAAQILAQGAGIQAAEHLVNAGAQVLLTGHVGPKAFAALRTVGVKMIQGLDNMTVQEAVMLFQTGTLVGSDAPSH